MHSLLAHAYHLTQHGLNVVSHPVWLSCAAALLIAAGGRLAGIARTPFGAAALAALAVCAGWLLLDTDWPRWPLPPLARLPVLALILTAEAAWAGGAAKARPGHAKRGKPAAAPERPGWPMLVAVSGMSAWWLRGAPLDGSGIIHCMPVFLGLAAALALSRRFAGRDGGWGHAAAAGALGLSLLVAGAASHWAQASLAPMLVALVLLGVAGLGRVLPGAVVMLAACTIVASDRGRLIPVDVACLMPLLAWGLTGRLASRAGRAGPAASAALAAGLCAGLAWAVKRAMWG